MPLSTEGLIEEIKQFRADKLALIALIGSMGDSSEGDALARLREIIRVTGEQLEALRKSPRDERRSRYREEALWRDVFEIANEVEPWLSQVVSRDC